MGLCGPSSGETASANNESAFAQTMSRTFSTQLASQTATLQQLNSNLQNLASGNTPMGFSADTLSRLRGGAVTNTAQLFRNAMQRQATNFSAQGGGGASALPSGVQDQVYGDIASAAAGKEADLLTGIDLENVQLGRENLMAATTGLEKMAELQSPESYAAETGSALSKSFDQQHTMSQEAAQGLAEVGGLITSGIGAATGLGALGAAGGAVGSSYGTTGGLAGTPTAGSLIPQSSPITGDLTPPAGWSPGVTAGVDAFANVG
jgi:hypothetical protein